MKYTLFGIAIATITLAAPTAALAQVRTGAGQTLQTTMPQQQQMPVNLMDTWQYKFVEKAAPIVKGVRDCSFGALGGGITYGVGGMVGGCIAGAAGVSPLQQLVKTNKAY